MLKKIAIRSISDPKWTLIPIDLLTCHYDGVSGAEGQDYGLHGEGCRKEIFRSRIRLFQIDGLGARSVGKACSVFEIDAESAQRNDEAKEPVDETEPNRTCAIVDRRSWTVTSAMRCTLLVENKIRPPPTCREDTGANHFTYV